LFWRRRRGASIPRRTGIRECRLDRVTYPCPWTAWAAAAGAGAGAGAGTGSSAATGTGLSAATGTGLSAAAGAGGSSTSAFTCARSTIKKKSHRDGSMNLFFK